MKRLTFSTLVLAAALSYCGALWADATITYQGRLDAGEQPFSGTANFDFALFDAPTGGSQVGATISEEGVAVTDGLFQVALDFGTDAFAGGGRWLRIRVNGTTLSPRQRITTVPLALEAEHALSADHADDADMVGGVSISGLQARVWNACSPGLAIRSIGADGSVVCQTLYSPEVHVFEDVTITSGVPHAFIGLFGPADSSAVFTGTFQIGSGVHNALPYRSSSNADVMELYRQGNNLVVRSNFTPALPVRFRLSIVRP